MKNHIKITMLGGKDGSSRSTTPIARDLSSENLLAHDEQERQPAPPPPSDSDTESSVSDSEESEMFREEMQKINILTRNLYLHSEEFLGYDEFSYLKESKLRNKTINGEPNPIYDPITLLTTYLEILINNRTAFEDMDDYSPENEDFSKDLISLMTQLKSSDKPEEYANDLEWWFMEDILPVFKEAYVEDYDYTYTLEDHIRTEMELNGPLKLFLNTHITKINNKLHEYKNLATRITQGGKKWSAKYKKSIDCKNPRGFSQRQYCNYGRKKKTGGKKTKKRKQKKTKKNRKTNKKRKSRKKRLVRK